ncbi:MAG: hypothetical protein CME70_19315 [Halobacteriovorax sp.]|nr:hypothetical protein [Halobacteriovorax sp.]|tara:strand:+ start:159 stop:788 length:630 start_codon:yes stop_codon:yes gene_type:complete
MSDWATVLNVWSNITIIIASLLCIGYVAKKNPIDKLSMFFAGLTGLIGIGSTIYHVYGTTWAQLTDIVPVWTFMVTYTGAAMYYMLGWSKRMTTLCMILFMTSLAATGVFHIEAPAVPWIPGAVMLWIFYIVLSRKGAAVAYGMRNAAACFTVAIPVKTLDPYACMHAVIGTHWVWHIIIAVMLTYLVTSMHDYRTKDTPSDKLDHINE